MFDLTKLMIPTDGLEGEAQVDNGATATCRVEAIFRDHRRKLIEEISRYPVVVGCIAWLTDHAVLRALATRKAVSIVVQKEDFLKPDSGGSPSALRRLYDDLPGLERWGFRHTAGYSYCGGGDNSAVRCVGNHNADKRPAFPRMHNKFLVFCERVAVPGEDCWDIEPAKVWTGSYNISDNATRSWENAVLIDDRSIADAYAREYGQIFGLSEPLDWSSAWSAPEYRIGS